MKVWILNHTRSDIEVYAESNLSKALKNMQWEDNKDEVYSYSTEDEYYIEDYATLRLVEVNE